MPEARWCKTSPLQHCSCSPQRALCAVLRTPTWKVTGKTFSSHPKTWLRATLSTCQHKSLKARQRDCWRSFKDKITGSVFPSNTVLMQLHLSKPSEWHLHFHIARAEWWATQRTQLHQSQLFCSRAELMQKDDSLGLLLICIIYSLP